MREADVVRVNELHLVYWAQMESKQAITTDGVMVGLVRGILVDKDNWTIPYIAVEVKTDMMERLNMERPFQSTLVTISTSLVKDIAYMVELNADLESLKGAVELFDPAAIKH